MFLDLNVIDIVYPGQYLTLFVITMSGRAALRPYGRAAVCQ